MLDTDDQSSALERQSATPVAPEKPSSPFAEQVEKIRVLLKQLLDSGNIPAEVRPVSTSLAESVAINQEEESMVITLGRAEDRGHGYRWIVTVPQEESKPVTVRTISQLTRLPDGGYDSTIPSDEFYSLVQAGLNEREIQHIRLGNL